MLPDPVDDESEADLAAAVYFPLAGGPPRVSTRSRPCGVPGVTKQLMQRGSGSCPGPDDKCFGAPPAKPDWLR